MLPKHPLRLIPLLFAFSFSSALAQTNISDVNICSYQYQTIFGVFTNYTIKTFPYDESYGADNFWTKWDIRYNSDNSVSFHVGGYYLSADIANGVGTATSIGDAETFWLEEAAQGTFRIKTYEGYYLSCKNGNFAAVQQTTNAGDSERWYFFQPKDAGSESISDANISNYSYQNIIGVFTNYILRSFPWEQTYGADTYWAKWDVVDHGDGTFSFKIGNYYLLADSNDGCTAATTLTGAGFFTLSEVSGSYYLQNHEGLYLTCTNNNFTTLTLASETSAAARWYFFEVEAPFVDDSVPVADAGADSSVQVNQSTTVDGSGSSDPNTSLVTYQWNLLEKPAGSSVNVTNVDAVTVTFVPDTNGEFVFQLIVANSSGDVSWADTVTITAEVRVEHAIYGSNVDDTSSFVDFSGNFTETPAVFAAMLTTNGGDTSAARVTDTGSDGFEVFIEEETSKDSETTHGSAESVGYLAMVDGTIYNSAGSAVGEVGRFSHGQSSASAWSSFSGYVNSYSNPVVYLQTNSYNGSDPCHMRIRNVDGSGFEYQLEEWDYDDGTHNSETVVYIVVEAGTHTLPNGSKLQAQTQNGVDTGWETVVFPSAFSSAPVVLSMTQTENGGDAVVTRQRNLSAALVQIKLQEEENNNNSHNNETIGVISIGN